MELKNALKLIKHEIEHFLTKADNRWIEPDDAKYLDVVAEYAPTLLDLWQNTRDKYVNKVKTKALEIDDTVEQYDIKPESSEYIDDALAILALAFGGGVAIGYNEVISRGYSVEMPDDLNNLLINEATEIKNYAQTALTNQQHDFDEILNQYINEKNGKQSINDWFNSNESRLIDRLLEGLVWYGTQYGFARAIIEGTGEESFLYWITENDKNVCKDCQDLGDNSPYSIDNPLHTVPGGGKTICGSSCRCILETRRE